MTNYTQAPWSIEDEQSRYIIRHDVMYVAEVVKESKEDQANAKRIVHCINTYDELVEAMEQTLSKLEIIRVEKGYNFCIKEMQLLRKAIETAKNS